jgi:hypothetical protein
MKSKKKVNLIKQKTLSITNINYIKNLFFFLNYSKFFFNNNLLMSNIFKPLNINIQTINLINKNLHFFYFFIIISNLLFIKNIYQISQFIIIKNLIK